MRQADGASGSPEGAEPPCQGKQGCFLAQFPGQSSWGTGVGASAKKASDCLSGCYKKARSSASFWIIFVIFTLANLKIWEHIILEIIMSTLKDLACSWNCCLLCPPPGLLIFGHFCDVFWVLDFTLIFMIVGTAASSDFLVLLMGS